MWASGAHRGGVGELGGVIDGELVDQPPADQVDPPLAHMPDEGLMLQQQGQIEGDLDPLAAAGEGEELLSGPRKSLPDDVEHPLAEGIAGVSAEALKDVVVALDVGAEGVEGDADPAAGVGSVAGGVADGQQTQGGEYEEVIGGGSIALGPGRPEGDAVQVHEIPWGGGLDSPTGGGAFAGGREAHAIGRARFIPAG